MTKICFVVTRIRKQVFTGGILCVLQHAHHLALKGHEVTVVTLQPSDPPDWFQGCAAKFYLSGRMAVIRRKMSRIICRVKREKTKADMLLVALQGFVATCLSIEPRIFPFAIRHSVLCDRAAVVMPESDVTIATSFETALAVALHGFGRKFYFCQHFEPYFANEYDDHKYAREAAYASYNLPMRLVANSSWLAETIERKVGRNDVDVSGNAIDLRVFHPGKGGRHATDTAIVIISYGGRGVQWKGFKDMAEGVALARRTSPVAIDWWVFGACELPPENSLAPFKSLGFLSQADLASAYRDADILLSASWYESFPLFPLEGMACGLPVITTQPGTEDYARHLETAFVVPPQDPQAISAAILSLIGDPILRRTLGDAGVLMAQNFSWTLASKRMESVLLKKLDS